MRRRSGKVLTGVKSQDSSGRPGSLGEMGEGSVMSWLANLPSLNLTRQGLQPLWPSLSGLGAALNIACFLVMLYGVCRRCLQSGVAGWHVGFSSTV